MASVVEDQSQRACLEGHPGQDLRSEQSECRRYILSLWVEDDMLTVVAGTLGELEAAPKNHAGIRVEVQEQMVANADLRDGQATQVHDPTVFVLNQQGFTHQRTMHRGALTTPTE